MTKQTYEFQAEVGRLLEIVTHSLYSNKEIFLRELISNAADACDKLRLTALQEKGYPQDTNYEIILEGDEKKKLLIIRDNGIGMREEELVNNLGTLAKSGTGAFLKALEKNKEDSNLIGQFGVGFYAAFMVADQVDVLTKSAKEGSEAFLWQSKGMGSFDITKSQKEGHGTDIILHLKEDAADYASEARLSHLVKTYSNFITVPILYKEEKENKQLNNPKPLWTQPKSAMTEEALKDFYQHNLQGFDDPWDHLYFRVEGMLDYTALLFFPSQKPMDLFDPKRESHLKLFVKRVFISGDCQALLPGYMRFMRGVVDAQDLPLNVSREMLQDDPRLQKINKGVVKKILNHLSKVAEKDNDKYLTFWQTFGAVLKEGLYEDVDNKETLFSLARFKTTLDENWMSLETYMEKAGQDQKEIYYLQGHDLATLQNNPQLEAFKANNIPVLLLTDPIDEFWVTTGGSYKEKSFKSISDKDVKAPENEEKKEPSKEDKKAAEGLIKQLKEIYGDKVKDVLVSTRLTTSPVCLVNDETAQFARLQAMMLGQQVQQTAAQKVLEINPTHPVFTTLKEADAASAARIAWLLLDEALIREGLPVENPAAFAAHLNALIAGEQKK